MMFAPIVLFVYKRVESLESCVISLQQNEQCRESVLYVFSDAAANAADLPKVQAVRTYLNTITGFKAVSIIHADTNKGLAQSVIDGISQVLNNHESVIVLEDDLLVSRNFLTFMNSALGFYAGHEKVLSISGFTLPIKLPSSYSHDVYFTRRVFSWGWATWKNKWTNIDWTVSDYPSFLSNKDEQRSFNSMGTDLSSMLHKQMNGQISSWAVRWCYHQFKHKLFTVFPVHSKVINVGFNADATHSGLNNKRYRTSICNEEQSEFSFPKEIKLDKTIIKQFTSHFTISTRVYYKLMDSFHVLLNLFK